MSNILKTQLKGWYPVLQETIESPYFTGVKEVLREDMKTEEIYPKGENIFKAFSICPIEDVKVVILGQDPYHDGSATGLAFANSNKATVMSPSLEIILEELETQVGLVVLPFNQNLEHWAEQGVLLLNTSLTVQQKSPGSHTPLWNRFTTDLLTTFSKLKQKVIYMLWGKHAEGYEKYIHKNNFILKASHPIENDGFLECDHFNKANEILLREYGEGKEIEWRYTQKQLDILSSDNIVKDNFDDYEQ